MEKKGEYSTSSSQKCKNSNDSTQAKNIFISSDRIQMWNKRRSCHSALTQAHAVKSASKEMAIKQSYKTDLWVQKAAAFQFPQQRNPASWAHL